MDSREAMTFTSTPGAPVPSPRASQTEATEPARASKPKDAPELSVTAVYPLHHRAPLRMHRMFCGPLKEALIVPILFL